MSKEFICLSCGKHCDEVEVDFGIGPDEYWGRTEPDIAIQMVSDCCETEYREREFDE